MTEVNEGLGEFNSREFRHLRRQQLQFSQLLELDN
jgi:hypothetical protein